MAIRTFPLLMSGTLLLRGHRARGRGLRGHRGGRLRRRRPAPGGSAARGPGLPDLAALRLDQPVQPADVRLGGRELVVHQRQRVAVDPLLVRLERTLQLGAPSLQERAATLQEADARLGLQVLEEREADGEAVVLRSLVAGALQQLPEELLAGGRDPVHVLPPADVLHGERHLDGALPLEPLQGRVERAVPHLPEAAQRLAEALLQLVAVHGALLEEPQDRQLEHLLRSLPIGSIHLLDTSYRCITTIYRT